MLGVISQGRLRRCSVHSTRAVSSVICVVVSAAETHRPQRPFEVSVRLLNPSGC